MWNPPQSFVFLKTNEEVFARTHPQVLFFDPRACATVPVSNSVGLPWMSLELYVQRRCLLVRSLFDLVLEKNVQNLRDRKLSQWFLSLSVEERTIIQTEGGLLMFILNHPAIEVVGQRVSIKHIHISDIWRQYRHLRGAEEEIRSQYSVHSATMSSNNSRFPTYNEVPLHQNDPRICPTAGADVYTGGLHVTSEAGENVPESEIGLELLPNCVRDELTHTNDGTQQNVHTQEVQTTLDTQCGWQENGSQRGYSSIPDTWHPPSTISDEIPPQAQCLLQLWKEVKEDKGTQSFEVQASVSHDMEPYRPSQAQNNPYHMEPETQRGTDQDLKPGDTTAYYSFSHAELDHTDAGAGGDSITATEESTSKAFDSPVCHVNAVDTLYGFPVQRPDRQLKEDSVKHPEKNMPGAQVVTSKMVDVSGDNKACFTSSRATEMDTFLPVKDVAFVKADKAIQTTTDKVCTSEKNTITEVDMFDLDVIEKAYQVFKKTEIELKQLKDVKARTESDCVERLRRAELRLLGLQYVMCQQHCWRRFLASPVMESFHPTTDDLPNTMKETLKTLENDYKKMRTLILSGVSLEDLKPLSVNVNSGVEFSPAAVLDGHLDAFACGQSSDGIGLNLDDGKEGINCRNNEDALADNLENDKHKRNLEQPDDGESISGETWFDAEEELTPRDQEANLTKQTKRESTKNLPGIKFLQSSTTQEDELLWNEKCSATKVPESFSNTARAAAVVPLKSPSDAQADVEDPRGRASSDPKTLDDDANGVSQSQKSEPAVEKPKTKDVKFYVFSPGGPSCSVDRLTNISNTPTASGTYVPEHNVTVGSFGLIVIRLMERHPEVSRQRIIEALLELWGKHQGRLSGLSLSSIEDMTSEILARAGSL